MNIKIELRKVKYLPNDLESGILYVSKKYGVVGHLCPCGCGNKVITPLDPFEWSIKINNGEASLFPSIGNWQLECKSHYWIQKGKIIWCSQWSEDDIKKGFETEETERKLYFEKTNYRRNRWSIFSKLINYFFRES